jgi:hypothetical protein
VRSAEPPKSALRRGHFPTECPRRSRRCYASRVWSTPQGFASNQGSASHPSANNQPVVVMIVHNTAADANGLMSPLGSRPDVWSSDLLGPFGATSRHATPVRLSKQLHHSVSDAALDHWPSKILRFGGTFPCGRWCQFVPAPRHANSAAFSHLARLDHRPDIESLQQQLILPRSES